MYYQYKKANKKANDHFDEMIILKREEALQDKIMIFLLIKN